jgi:hypothetical protein
MGKIFHKNLDVQISKAAMSMPVFSTIDAISYLKIDVTVDPVSSSLEKSLNAHEKWKLSKNKNEFQ